MSCDRRCFEKDDKWHGHTDCVTCPGHDSGFGRAAWSGCDQPGVVARFAELCVYVESLIAAEREGAMAAILDGCPNDGSDAEIILRRAWERVRVRSNMELTRLAVGQSGGAKRNES